MFDLLLTREYLLSQASLMGETSLFKSSIIENRRKVFSILWKVCKTFYIIDRFNWIFIVWMGSNIETKSSCFDKQNKSCQVIFVFKVLILIDRNPGIPSVFTQLLLSFPFGNIIDEASVCRATKLVFSRNYKIQRMDSVWWLN